MASPAREGEATAKIMRRNAGRLPLDFTSFDPLETRAADPILRISASPGIPPGGVRTVFLARG
jgi:hypothetical protein